MPADRRRIAVALPTSVADNLRFIRCLLSISGARSVPSPLTGERDGVNSRPLSVYIVTELQISSSRFRARPCA
jgi:hypothetical protein